MPHCSYCREIGHNIRTCQDPSIKEELNTYLAFWIGPDLILENIISFTEHARRVLRRQIKKESRHLIRAISIRYCEPVSNPSLAKHIDNIVDRIAAEAVRVNEMNEEQREQWCMEVTGMSMWDWQDHLDDIDEEIADADAEPKKHPVYDIILNLAAEPSECHEECAICQEEKPADRFDKTQCSHSFCHECITTHLESKQYNRASCPLCRTEITSLETTVQELYESLYSRFSETGALMKDCLHMWGLE